MTNGALPFWTQFHVEQVQANCLQSTGDALTGFPAPYLPVLNLDGFGDLSDGSDELQAFDHAAPVALFVLAHG